MVIAQINARVRTVARALSRPAVACIVAVFFAFPARAQVVAGTAQGIGSLAAERARIAQITGSAAADTADTKARIFERMDPSLLVIRNSDIPYSLNDGPLWAGRGYNASVTAGVAFAARSQNFRLRAVLAPTITYSQNLPFQIFPGRDSSRSTFSSPWHLGASSADLPLRFGDRPLYGIYPGESSLELESHGVTAGVSSASEWWGPAIRNTLILSNNAAGIPRAFVRLAHPIDTRVGQFDGRLIAGTLTESRFFDTTGANGYRALSGLLLTYRTAFDTGLTVGFSRVVYRPVSGATSTLSHAFDAITQWEPLASPSDTLPNGQTKQKADQLFSLFARWIFPESGTEAYAEWARVEPPRSFTEWLIAPQSTQGYTLGMQNARKLSPPGTFWRTQLELTYLEQTDIWPDRPPPDYYTGRVSPQGYTQRGQIIGAAIGPGASAQFLGMDYMAHDWQLGAFAGRTRWENDVLYRQPGANAARHDVTIYSGIRGALRRQKTDLSGEITVGRRLNYLFQNDAYNAGERPRSAIDIQNVTLTLRIAPRKVPLR